VTGAAVLLAGCGENGDENGGTQSPDETSPGETGEATGEELARTDEIPVGGGKVFADRKIVVTQPEQGEFKAFSAICTHQNCTVANVSDQTINCNCHGSKFSITDGAVENGPATRPLPAEQITVTGNSIRQA
jgi:Rieske Fe-S protein